MKKVFKLINVLIFTSYYTFAQMQPADSLPGIYAGEYWYADPAGSPWIITLDTMYVQSIDSVNCIAVAYDTHILYNWEYYTDYYSCNGLTPISYYMKFYNVDSVKEIEDNIAQPMPNPPISHHFYGKRIGKITTGINNMQISEQIKIFPNPGNKIMTIENKRKEKLFEIKITDIMGVEVRIDNQNTTNENVQIDIKDLQEGIYFFNIKTRIGTIVKKIIVN